MTTPLSQTDLCRAVPPASQRAWQRMHPKGAEPGRKPPVEFIKTSGTNYSVHQNQECPHCAQALCSRTHPFHVTLLLRAAPPLWLPFRLGWMCASWLGVSAVAPALSFQDAEDETCP
jgi:hypothetical protein